MKTEFQIRVLLVKEIFGTITPEETEELHVILSSNPAARAIRKDVMTQSYRGVRDKLDYTNDVAKHFPHLYDTYRELPLNKFGFWGLIFFITFCGWGILYITLSRDPRTAPPRPITRLIPGQLHLQLTGGETLMLKDTGMQYMRVWHTAIQQNNNTISFTALPGRSAAESFGWNTLTVPNRKLVTVILPDGSEVMVNSGSTLRFPFQFGPGTRDIFLEGEAFFRVSKNQDRAFRIHAGQANIIANGATLNVNAYNATMVKTTLLEGKTMINMNSRRAVPPVGSTVQMTTGEVPAYLTGGNIYHTDWLRDTYHFSDMTVREFEVILMRWFKMPLLLDAPEAAYARISGTMAREEPLSDFFGRFNVTGQPVIFYWGNGELRCGLNPAASGKRE